LHKHPRGIHAQERRAHSRSRDAAHLHQQATALSDPHATVAPVSVPHPSHPADHRPAQDLRRDLGDVGHVAILTDPGGPVLPGIAGVSAFDGHVAILTDPGGPVLRAIVGVLKPGHSCQYLSIR
jgi:hypothetical protein